MLEEIEYNLDYISNHISNNMNKKAWANTIKYYEKLRERFLKTNLNLQAILCQVSIGALLEKQEQLEKAGNIILKAAKEFESIKKKGYAFKAYQRALDIMKSLNKIEIIEEIQNKIDSMGMLDLIIVTDSTGSMSGALNAIRREIAKMLYLLTDKIPGVRVAALTYRDHCDEKSSYLLKSYPFTEHSEFTDLTNFIKNWTAGGGGDIPEAIEDALNHLQHGFEWESTIKIAILIADAPPHEFSKCPKKLDWKKETIKLADEEVKIYTILTGSDVNARKIFKEISKLTQAKSFDLKNIPDLPDLIIAIALAQVQLVEDFIIDLESEGQLSESKKELLEKLLR